MNVTLTDDGRVIVDHVRVGNIVETSNGYVAKDIRGNTETRPTEFKALAHFLQYNWRRIAETNARQYPARLHVKSKQYKPFSNL